MRGLSKLIGIKCSKCDWRLINAIEVYTALTGCYGNQGIWQLGGVALTQALVFKILEAAVY